MARTSSIYDHFDLSWLGGGGGGRGGRGRWRGARVSDFFHKESKSKKKLFFFWGGRGWGGWGVGGRVDGWTDEQAQTNFAFNFFDVNVQVMSLTSSIYDHFII